MLLLIITFVSTSHYRIENEQYLIKIIEGEYDEPGVKCGYMNLKGDTIIPLGKYLYCYTDTLKNFAVVLDHDYRCLAIDRKGKELYEVYWYDNGPDYVSDGLFRIVKNGKIGYANEHGNIVIKPVFECANPFEHGIARVTYKCERTVEGEHVRMKSTGWFYINTNGQKVSDLELPPEEIQDHKERSSGEQQEIQK
ncbi:WG repeat-containing protein [Bacteroidota bacterium]